MNYPRILLVGPLNKEGVGGRLEEMKVWAKLFARQELEVCVFTPNFSGKYFGEIDCLEAIDLILGFKKSIPKTLKTYILRIWYSRIFKFKRDSFYQSKAWKSFAEGFSHLFLFITDDSKERMIFESDLPSRVMIRYTGTLHSFDKILRDNQYISQENRAYIFHSTDLIPGLVSKCPQYFIDQTCLQEEKLKLIPPTKSVKRFAMVGLFMHVKQMEPVVRLFSQLPDLTLLLFGQGELETHIKDIITKEKIQNVQIKGFVSPDNIETIYSQFDVLILNSLHETGPMIGIEAMAAGKLILSRPIGSMRTRLKGFDDFIFNDQEELLAQIKKIKGLSEDRILDYSNKLRERYLNQYSSDAISEQIISLIHRS